MSMTQRFFLLDDSETLWRLTKTKLDALIDGKETLLQFAGQKLRFVELIVELENRQPIRVLRAAYAYCSFRADGTLDTNKLLKRGADAMNAMHEKAQLEGQRVVEAQGRFQQRGSQWTPHFLVRNRLDDAALGRIKIASC